MNLQDIAKAAKKAGKKSGATDDIVATWPWCLTDDNGFNLDATIAKHEETGGVRPRVDRTTVDGKTYTVSDTRKALTSTAPVLWNPWQDCAASDSQPPPVALAMSALTDDQVAKLGWMLHHKDIAPFMRDLNALQQMKLFRALATESAHDLIELADSYTPTAHSVDAGKRSFWRVPSPVEERREAPARTEAERAVFEPQHAGNAHAQAHAMLCRRFDVSGLRRAVSCMRGDIQYNVAFNRPLSEVAHAVLRGAKRRGAVEELRDRLLEVNTGARVRDEICRALDRYAAEQ